MSYLHTARCPIEHGYVEVCTSDEDGYETGTRFSYECPECGKTHFLVTGAVVILDGEKCPDNAVDGFLMEEPAFT